MSLVEKYALLPDEIDRRSIEVVEASLPQLDGLTPEERYVVCRIVRAEGDPEIAKAVGFSPGAVDLGIAAIKAKAAVVTDVRMVKPCSADAASQPTARSTQPTRPSVPRPKAPPVPLRRCGS